MPNPPDFSAYFSSEETLADRFREFCIHEQLTRQWFTAVHEICHH